MSGGLCVESLSAWYTSAQPVLEDVSFTLDTHEIVGLIGCNGAGKTTLFNVLSGLHAGFGARSVCWNGEPVQFRDVTFKQVRYSVFSEDSAFGYFSFREYLRFVSRIYKRSLSDVEMLVEGFRFKEYVEVPIRDLSTGNRKKVFLITALALRPPLLFLDEPVNGLDFQSTEFFYQCLRAYRATGTVLFSSHVLESVTLTADRVLVLESGRIGRTFSKETLDGQTIREVLNDDG